MPELSNWKAYRFSKAETRVVGFTDRGDGTVVGVISEPVSEIYKNEIVTVDNKVWHLKEEADTAAQIHIMYMLGRWAEENRKNSPTDITEQWLKEWNDRNEKTNK